LKPPTSTKTHFPRDENGNALGKQPGQPIPRFHTAKTQSGRVDMRDLWHIWEINSRCRDPDGGHREKGAQPLASGIALNIECPDTCREERHRYSLESVMPG
jgi:hypothetical protein